MSNKILVIYHRADFDGLFCYAIARHYHGETADYLGWHYGDPVPVVPAEVTVILMLDISIPELMADKRLVWIDHHKTAMDKFRDVAGWRIDGVAACRLTWQWFEIKNCKGEIRVPVLRDFVERRVSEPLAVRLAGEYDIWDKRDPCAEVFQHGLRSVQLEVHWHRLLSTHREGDELVAELLKRGEILYATRLRENYSIIKELGFDLEFGGLKFLACNSISGNSDLFTAGLRPDHDGCLSFKYDGRLRKWRVSLRGVPGKPDVDLAAIASANGGGGHKQACGFECATLPFAL